MRPQVTSPWLHYSAGVQLRAPSAASAQTRASWEVTACTSLCPGMANPTHNSFPGIRVGTWAGAGMGSRQEQPSHVPALGSCQTHLSRHTCAAARTILPVCPLSCSSTSLPVLTVTSFWSCAFLFSVSLAQSLTQEIKDNPPFFCCRIPCLTFAACACTDSKRD